MHLNILTPRPLKAAIAIRATAAMTFTGCDNYVDITPTGVITMDSASQYLELVAFPQRSYYPSAFAMLSDNAWIKESTVIGHESQTYDGINTTFNEQADRNELADNNLYENCYAYILRENIVISQADNSIGDSKTKSLAKAEARIMRAWDHFVAVNTFAKAYDPSTAATDGGVPIVDSYDLEGTPTKATVDQVYNFIIGEVEASLPYLEEKPLTAYHPSKAFGYAFAALVYLFHHDYDKALEAANSSLALNNSLVDYVALKAAGGPTKDKRYAKGGNPEVLHRVDADRMIVTLAELIGCPESCMKSDEQVADAIEADQQAAAQQAQLAQAQAQASAAKDIGSIPLDEEHAGSAIAEAMAQNDGMGGMA